jgi:multidrug efflux pump subunit AcrB
VSVQLYGDDNQAMEQATEQIRAYLASFDGVFDIEDSLQNGKRELIISLKPEAELLGLNLMEVTRQVRSAFFGVEAQRIQRGRDDIRVMVRYPEQQRVNLAQLENLLITTPAGAEARFADLANVRWSRSPDSIIHTNQLRTVEILADIDRERVVQSVLIDQVDAFTQQLLLQYPGLSHSMEGEASMQREANRAMALGLMGVLFGIYALLAIAFKSYQQPLIIMSVIPFSLIGAIVGHVITNLGMSMFSIFGILALVGVVVNDSLVLVDWINRRQHQGESIEVLVRQAGRARFRAVLLTSLTTFLGLMPILFQTSTSAQFLIPMATSLGFGILFATVITLILVPCNYLMLRDMEQQLRRLRNWLHGNSTEVTQSPIAKQP